MLRVMLAAALLGPSYTPSPAAREANTEAEVRFKAGDYGEAARAWVRIHELLPENEINRAERDNTLHLALIAFMQSYKDNRDQDVSRRALLHDVQLLREGQAFFDGYEAEFKRVHRKDVSTAARSFADELARLLAEGEAELEAEAPPPVIDRGGPGPGPGPIVKYDIPRHNGVGLIVGGSLVLAAGLGTIPMIVIGAGRNDRQGDAMLTTGAVLGTLCLAGGATMLGIGIKRRLDYTAFTPTVGPRYVGFGLRGRF